MNFFQDAIAAFHKSGMMHQLVGEDVGEESNILLMIFYVLLRLTEFRNLFRRKSSPEAISTKITWCEQATLLDYEQCFLVCQPRHDLSVRQRLAGLFWRHYLSGKETIIFRCSDEVIVNASIVFTATIYLAMIFLLNRPFREVKIETNTKSWHRVKKLEKGNVYAEVNQTWLLVPKKELCFVWSKSKGNLTTLIEMTKWAGNNVLYTGDHIYGDLAVSSEIRKKIPSETFSFVKDLFLKHGWRTAAILEEVEVRQREKHFEKETKIWTFSSSKDEIQIINSEGFQKTIRWVRKWKSINDWILNDVFPLLLVKYSSVVDRSITSQFFPMKRKGKLFSRRIVSNEIFFQVIPGPESHQLMKLWVAEREEERYR